MKRRSKLKLSDYDPILNLWKGQENKRMQPSEIERRLNILDVKKWNQRTMFRYLEKMCALGLLKKEPEGKLTFYQTTDRAHEYNITSMLEKTRRYAQTHDLINRETDFLHVYGLPAREKLTATEQENFDQIVHRLENGFMDLFFLKRSVYDRICNNNRDLSNGLYSFEEACLALVATAPADEQTEYYLNLEAHIKELIQTYGELKIPINDKALVTWAETLLKRQSILSDRHLRKKVLALRRWAWLRAKISGENVEKLTRILVYFLQPVTIPTPTQPIEPQIHIVTDEEEDQRVQEIVREASKLEL